VALGSSSCSESGCDCLPIIDQASDGCRRSSRRHQPKIGMLRKRFRNCPIWWHWNHLNIASRKRLLKHARMQSEAVNLETTASRSSMHTATPASLFPSLDNWLATTELLEDDGLEPISPSLLSLSRVRHERIQPELVR
jgi:hypothetical protein